jgi:hypothetical protein
VNSASAAEGRFLLKAGIFPQLFIVRKVPLAFHQAALQSCRKGLLALYQGTTSVVPKRVQNKAGL